MKEIKLFRFVTGQDMIAQLVETTDLVYKVEKALILQVTPTADRLQVQFAPISHEMIGSFPGQVNHMDAPSFELNRGAVMFVYDPAIEIADNYSQATGAIQIATGMPPRT